MKQRNESTRGSRLQTWISGMVVAMSLTATHVTGDIGAVLQNHPASQALTSFFAAPRVFDENLKSSGLSRKDYLPLIAGNVDHWLKHQNADGAIIDPDSKGERQYSTPAFALAAGLLVAEADRKDLLEPAVKAMTFATHQLAIGKSADGHADFYTPMLIHARRILKPLVSADVVAKWDADLKSIDPERIYNMRLKSMNWNLVSSCGELLRRKDGLVEPAKMDAHLKYLEDRLADHMHAASPLGLYKDPGVPMAYDAFGRLWLDDMMANDAYDGALAEPIRTFLARGGLSSLLLLSPAGEWPGGGRSSHHQWNEAELIAICEIHANHWRKAKRPEIAGAFKRAARLALQSMQRWQRPSGELNIIKNRYEPAKRFAYESYSNHSQYNLLPMAMLAIAYQHADDQITEQPMPSEAGAYVFDAHADFHKVAAAGGGYYVLIDTAADPHYNATGLQRVHRVGVAFSPLTDSAVERRAYGKNDGAGKTFAPGLQWHAERNEQWTSLGDAFLLDPKKPKGDQTGAVSDLALHVTSGPGDEEARFTINWKFVGSPASKTEQYTLSKAGVRVEERVDGTDAGVGETRLVIPVTAFDGVDESKITLSGRTARVETRASVLTWTVESPAVGDLKLDETRSPAHPGLLQAIIAPLPDRDRSATWTVTLE